MDSNILSTLTDCHMRAFSILYDAEQTRRTKAETRLTAVLDAVDVLAREPDHSDYIPRGDRPS